MATTFTNSLDSDASADFTYHVSGVTVTYPGEGIRLNTGGAGDYSLGIIKTIAAFGVPGMYFEWYTTRASSGGTYAFSGIRKTGTLDATGTYGVAWISANLETTFSSTAVGSANDTWFKIRLVLKDDDTLDVYVDDVFIENGNPGTSLIGQALYLQLGGAFYSPVVGYKDVAVYDPREAVDSSTFDASTGFTLVETQGTAVFDGEYSQTKTTANNWTGAGIYRTSPTTMQVGDRVTFIVKGLWSGLPESIIWIRADAAINISTGIEGVGIYLHQSAGTDYLTRQNATSINDLEIGSDVWYRVDFTCDINGHLHIWATSDGDGPTTLIGSHTATTFDGNDYYFATSIWYNSTTIKLDNYEWLQLPEPPTGGDTGTSAVHMHNILKRRKLQ